MRTIGRFSIVALASIAAPQIASAHSLESLQQQLYEKEQYFQAQDRPAPDFRLQDSEGKAIRLSDLRGKVVVLHFIYASCPDVCPLHAEKIAEIQSMINITPMKRQVEFVTVTTDPERDTPDVLREYGSLHGLDPVNWMFLTRTPDQPESTTRKVAEDYGHRFVKTEDGLQMHGTVTHVIDRDGRWRANFHGLDFNSTNLIVYINALVNDVHKPGTEHNDGQSFWQRLLSWLQLAMDVRDDTRRMTAGRVKEG